MSRVLMLQTLSPTEEQALLPPTITTSDSSLSVIFCDSNTTWAAPPDLGR
ncbi:hypothetical protein ACIQU5_30565 [Streptomyces sp. NPDC090306]